MPALRGVRRATCCLIHAANGTPQEKGRFPERIIFTRNSLDPAWRALIAEFPDRFMVGVDDVHSWGEYEQVIDSIRLGLPARLSPATAEKVASQNGVRLFRLT